MNKLEVGDIVRLKNWKNFDPEDFRGGVKTSNFRDISSPAMNSDMATMSERGLLAKIRAVEDPVFWSNKNGLYELSFFQESESTFDAHGYYYWKESWLEPVDGFSLIEKEEN